MVVTATNLAGRGTDLKISNNVEQNGGLHVIITFLPRND
jgi:preprotein translocase subunit SecA